MHVGLIFGFSYTSYEPETGVVTMDACYSKLHAWIMFYLLVLVPQKAGFLFVELAYSVDGDMTVFRRRVVLAVSKDLFLTGRKHAIQCPHVLTPHLVYMPYQLCYVPHCTSLKQFCSSVDSQALASV